MTTPEREDGIFLRRLGSAGAHATDELEGALRVAFPQLSASDVLLLVKLARVLNESHGGA